MSSQAVAAFNLGIELGQIAILAMTLATLWAVSRLSERIVRPVRISVLAGIGLVAAYWTFERAWAMI